MQQHEQGWDFTDESVCSGCVNEDALKAILRESEDVLLRCDFCRSVPAAPLDVLLEAFVNGLRNEYENALEGVSWDGREGGYQWNPQWDTWDLVTDFEGVFVDEDLLDAVRQAVHDITWVESDFVTRRRDVVLTEAWNRFCEAVKFETRFVFWLLPDDDDLGAGEIPPAKILDQIGPLIDQLDLIRELPAGYRLWRAHTHEEHAIEHSAARLGTAPREFALKANRMSPAGIPMFYGSTDAGTAIREVACKSDDAYVTWGQFELTASLAVADFTRLPAEPSMFDPELGSVRRQILFLNMFVNQLSDRAQPQHKQIDYVPTQIVTEYLLRIHGGGNRSRGLTYQSSLTAETCMALDVRDDHCLDPTGAPPDASVHLKLVADSVECRSITEADRSI